MKKIVIIFLAVFIGYSANGQFNDNIIITKLPKTVPVGKKWIIEAGQTTIIEANYGVLNSGSLCNALFLSSPQMLSNINIGGLSESESYILIFKDLEKVPYTNDHTYKLTIISIMDKNFQPEDLQYKKPEDVGKKRIEFKTGESVFVGSCLESIQLKETNISTAESLDLKKKEDEIYKEIKDKHSNFQIPVNQEKYIKPGTIPEIYDSKLKSIVFSSLAVLFKQPGKNYALDNVSSWTLSLTADKFNLTNSNGIDKTYTVLKIEYDEQMGMQKFILGNSQKEKTHVLLISYSNSSNQYSLILSSNDKTESFQFQEVQSTDKQFQMK
uniref:hypothetical protein n=1 Tax=Fulvivirga sp. TaxID=1931237 RepID=UPI00404901E5